MVLSRWGRFIRKTIKWTVGHQQLMVGGRSNEFLNLGLFRKVRSIGGRHIGVSEKINQKSCTLARLNLPLDVDYILIFKSKLNYAVLGSLRHYTSSVKENRWLLRLMNAARRQSVFESKRASSGSWCILSRRLANILAFADWWRLLRFLQLIIIRSFF